METKSLLTLHAEYFRTQSARATAYVRTCERLDYPEGHYREDDCAVCAECRARHEAFIAAAEAARAAERALIDAVFSADWGPQMDGSFVAISNCWPNTDLESRALHAPAKQGVLAEFLAKRWVDYERGVGYIRGVSRRIGAIYTRSEARAKREADRAARRAADAVYEAQRIAAGEALLAGQGLPWSHGQEGGTVEVGDAVVGAPGALRAASVKDKIDWDLVGEIERMEDERHRSSWRLSHDLTWLLYIDGFVAIASDGVRYAVGSAARAACRDLDIEPTEARVQDLRAGKRVWCDSPFPGERRTSKRIARRAQRRYVREELRTMM
ncbi:MAG: hypothetical protein E6Q97_21765 [Desulfurellales bacterium]|nr:MAG: hypothetical protein E6Q97_21765 [Desulfurellales bacterium]